MHAPEGCGKLGQFFSQRVPYLLRLFFRFGQDVAVRPSEREGGAGEVGREFVQQRVGQEFGTEDEAGEAPVIGDVQPPEILRVGVQLAFAVFVEFGVEGDLAEEGVVAEHSAAEAVDGVDGGGVELRQGGF